MKKLLLVFLAILMLSGCTWHKAKKWFEEMDWERDDQTVQMMDIFFR